ncbi:MAG: YlcI/YnfO family protein [Gemmatimonadota bacterium]
MRTTVRLPDELMRAAKRRAQETGRSLTQLLEDCLRAELRQPSRARRVSEPLPTYAGKGLQPGVDLTDASALEDLMSGR